MKSVGITLNSSLDIGESCPKAEKIAKRVLELANAVKIEDAPAPDRCRAILLSSDGKNIAVIRRTREGTKPYAVLPGGGVEDEDASPIDGILRELEEELSIQASDLTLITERVIVIENQWVFVGIAKPSVESFILGGPEKERNQNPSIHGTYEPVWISIGEVEAENVLPSDIRPFITEASIGT